MCFENDRTMLNNFSYHRSTTFNRDMLNKSVFHINDIETNNFAFIDMIFNCRCRLSSSKLTIKSLWAWEKNSDQFAYVCLCSLADPRRRTKITPRSEWRNRIGSHTLRTLGIESRATSTPDSRRFSAEVCERARGPLTSPDPDLTPEVSGTRTAREFA